MPRRPDTPCSRCGKLLWGGTTSAPAGRRTCQECRRLEPMPTGPYKGKSAYSTLYPPSHAATRRRLLPLAIGKPCPVCGKIMTADQKLHLDHSVPLWQDPTRRPGDRIIHASCNVGWTRGFKVAAPKGSTKERGYGPAHQKLRREWAKKVEAGGVHCSKCGDWIEPQTPWHLAHDPDDRSIYAGPQHARCNLREVTVTRRKNGIPNGNAYWAWAETQNVAINSRVW